MSMGLRNQTIVYTPLETHCLKQTPGPEIGREMGIEAAAQTSLNGPFNFTMHYDVMGAGPG